MNSMPSIETVLGAIDAVFKASGAPAPSGSRGTEKAAEWLDVMQKSVYAWQISDQLIQMNRDEETCYFAAQTMRTKIQFAFHELPLESHQSLRDSLLKHCTKINLETKNTIVTQLCLALADLFVQMASWKGGLSSLIQEFGNNTHHWTFLVEFLSVLPEEINSRHIRIGDNRRNELLDEMTQASPLLVQLLAKITESAVNDLKTKERLMHCLGSWLSAFAIPEEYMIQSKLLHLPFAIMTSVDTPIGLHSAATECICSALIAVEDLLKNSNLARLLFEGVVQLQDPYHMSVAMQDLEKSTNYCRVFTEMAESFLEPMITTPNQGFGDLRTLELLLMCIGHHHYEVADITFNFWNRLSEVLYEENNADIINVFRPYIQRLIIALCRLCQYESTMEGLPEDSNDFEEFRRQSVDLVKDVEFVAGATAIVIQMFETLKGLGPNSSWEVAEATLLIIGAVAKYVDREEMSAVPQVLQAITSQPPETHLTMLRSSMRLIGEFSKWINFHPEFLEPCLVFLMRGLHHLKLSTSAADSIQKLCCQCAEHMRSQFNGLFEVIRSIDSLNISLRACLNLLKASAMILSHQPSQIIPEGFKQLCVLQVEPLNKIVNLGDIKVNRDDKLTDPIVWLDRLSVIFSHTTPEVAEGQVHPCRDVIVQVWPVLSNCFQKYSGDSGIIERCCRCVRYAVRCLGRTSCDLLNPVLSQIVALYQDHPHSCFLYLGSVLVDEYGYESACVPLLLNMLQALSVPAFKMLEESNGLQNHPDTVDDLFRLTLRCLQKMPIAFLQNPIAKNILLCGIASLSIHHRDANESVTKYLVEFIKFANDKPESQEFSTRHSLILDMLKDYGQALVQAVVKASIDLPNSLIDNSAEVVYELSLIDKGWVSQWLHVGLQSLHTQSPGGAIIATPQQLEEFHTAVTSAAKSKAVCHAFRDLAKLYS